MIGQQHGGAVKATAAAAIASGGHQWQMQGGLGGKGCSLAGFSFGRQAGDKVEAAAATVVVVHINSRCKAALLEYSIFRSR